MTTPSPSRSSNWDQATADSGILLDNGANGTIKNNTINGPAAGPGNPSKPSAGIKLDGIDSGTSVRYNTVARFASDIRVQQRQRRHHPEQHPDRWPDRPQHRRRRRDVRLRQRRIRGDRERTVGGWSGERQDRREHRIQQQHPRQRLPDQQQRRPPRLRGLFGRGDHQQRQHVRRQQGQQQQIQRPCATTRHRSPDPSASATPPGGHGQQPGGHGRAHCHVRGLGVSSAAMHRIASPSGTSTSTSGRDARVARHLPRGHPRRDRDGHRPARRRSTSGPRRSTSRSTA